MTKEKIKIHFVDFWPNFIKNDNYFYHLLQSEFNVVLTDNNPDLLFFSVDYSNNKEHLNYQNTNTKNQPRRKTYPQPGKFKCTSFASPKVTPACVM